MIELAETDYVLLSEADVEKEVAEEAKNTRTTEETNK